ncbi:MAG: serine/threonine-protein phosphatase, partial [Candidatus Marinimicrobia bacterium]|nr:serine/threonine-protein phosphatase [Candidatus Neomarinimicrobiota bacterium]
MKYITAADSIMGLRKTNQDRYAEFSIKNIKIMCLADGNGGQGGEIIANYAIKSLAEELFYELARLRKATLNRLVHIGKEAIRRTAEDIDTLKFLCPNLSSCGTTLTLVFIYKSAVITLWVGDSPAILYQNGKITRLVNPPHTLAEMLIARGESRESIEKQAGLSSTLTRCIGFKNTTPGINMTICKPPFSVIVASDGIDYIPDDELEKIFNETHLTECLP